MTENKIKALFVFEILGRPPEHIKETLSDLIDKLEKIPGISIDNKTIHDAKPVEKEGVENLFTSFAEVEVNADELNNLLLIVFHMLPAHVEILEPRELRFKNFDISSMLSELTVKLHKYDEIAKGLVIERNTLMKKLQEAEEKINGFESEIKGGKKTEKVKKDT